VDSDRDDLDEIDDDFVGDAPAERAAPADRYKRRVETRAPAAETGSGRSLAIATVLIAAIAGLLLWLQPWKSTPLELTAITNERVELIEVAGPSACVWRFDIEIKNTTDERVWITSVDMFLNDEAVRPKFAFGFIDGGVESAMPVEVFLGSANANGRCPAVAGLDHSPIDVVHATVGESSTASIAF